MKNLILIIGLLSIGTFSFGQGQVTFSLSTNHSFNNEKRVSSFIREEVQPESEVNGIAAIVGIFIVPSIIITNPKVGLQLLGNSNGTNKSDKPKFRRKSIEEKQSLGGKFSISIDEKNKQKIGIQFSFNQYKVNQIWKGLPVTNTKERFSNFSFFYENVWHKGRNFSFSSAIGVGFSAQRVTGDFKYRSSKVGLPFSPIKINYHYKNFTAFAAWESSIHGSQMGLAYTLISKKAK